ncbi:MAG: di-heme oxidoredictase family protein [Xanthobacteraceae bacterium]|jgi:CxxC motif-containing protein (DUF1111 family)
MRRTSFNAMTAVNTIMISLLAVVGLAYGQAAGVAAGAATGAAPGVPAAAAAGAAAGVVDHGLRGGPAGAGGPLQGLTTAQTQFWKAAQGVFEEILSVQGASQIPGTVLGLGPRFNGNSCALCHSQPAVGGTSPATNPQRAIANLNGATNIEPSFIPANGPAREARFIKNSDGTPDGGVHDLFVITGRTDAPGCNIQQPNFDAQIAANNIIFRIPTPVFGVGLVENTPDGNLKTDSSNISGQQLAVGIASGIFNTSGNDGTITRFGWKAQNKSLLMFSGEASNVEMGLTNELFPNERDDTPGCIFNPTPEDSTNLADNFQTNSPAADISSDIVDFAAFMRLNAAPVPVAQTGDIPEGNFQFLNIGCGLCHIPQHTTAQSIFQNQSFVTYTPFSDFALHDMGGKLRDGISQGSAGVRQFRSAPLWGVGQRIFFLHDGRTADLVATIEAHSSANSEANQVINNFNLLQASDQQAIIDFLRSL